MSHPKKAAFKSALDFSNRSLALCLNTIAQQQRLLTLIKAGLPEDIAEHVLHCVIAETQLLIYTDSAAWASQIRFFHTAILNKLHSCGQQKIAKLQVRISPQMGALAKIRRVKLPSRHSADVIQGAVRGDAGDELDMALSRLASTLRKRLGESA